MRIPSVILLVAAALLLFAGCDGDGGNGDPKRVERAGTSTTAEEPTRPDPAASGGSTKRIAEARGTLTAKMVKVGSKDGGGIPAPAGMACERSLPATCVVKVTCPAGGDAPAGRADVCSWLAGDGIGLLSAEAPEGQVCAEQYGGPEVLTVSGEMNGTTIDATFSRTNGCEIGRFESVAPLYRGR
ncbi:MAG: hypothetical protein JWM86_145, partial [Thermoleophilia bacterium]|nr:hypothetical protein [Thermoleophilia bacterium]